MVSKGLASAEHEGEASHMKRFMSEFKEFIARGNVMDMAVGVIIGGAFTAIVSSLTDNIINPLITFITGGGIDMSGALVVPGTSIDFGAFISAIINFLIVALVVFALVKALNKMQAATDKLGKKGTETEAAPAPTCPYCLEEVKEGATKCSHCGSALV
jgi:large conductance mechanosensitive channel